jgi:hypothetical protein
VDVLIKIFFYIYVVMYVLDFASASGIEDLGSNLDGYKVIRKNIAIVLSILD